ncbi:cyclic pyranopterin monophosphate synthase [Marinobacterium nitratireducens]|uniref:GTP 3',8-cyclase n=1 Tax=Marinobacterium nitratireducens TaxID=518897 RepID=A0A917Z6F0_9GAMM|nr:GTP 3',8-cyclase MoaA [Marinobacterium nitratireducens]GGO76570.1 cyclic pyranopterin monophosphate synthase [Marinobacterium nitratireducens]
MHSHDAQLIDGFGRRIDYVRLSVTDRCDFRCVYCMAEDMTFLPRARVLTLEEMALVGRAFSELGVRRIRLTGGEPLVRRDILELVQSLGRLEGLDELTMTTNGSQLRRFAGPLRDAGLNRLNISLDSLDPVRFASLTRRDRLAQVLEGIDAAIAAGFERIKLNAVILNGRNDDEILPLVEYARSKAIDISFIEEMPLGAISEHDRSATFCSSDEVLARINERHALAPSTETTGGPSRYYRMADSAIRIGLISPHSHNFCASCNRVRVTAEGRLLLCLGNENSVDLRALLRRHPGDLTRLKSAIVEAIGRKPKHHWFDDPDQPQVLRFMNMTGG